MYALLHEQAGLAMAAPASVGMKPQLRLKARSCSCDVGHVDAFLYVRKKRRDPARKFLGAELSEYGITFRSFSRLNVQI